MKQDNFFDEQIIDMRNQAEQKAKSPDSALPHESEKKQSIDQGMKILGKWIYFERSPLSK